MTINVLRINDLWWVEKSSTAGTRHRHPSGHDRRPARRSRRDRGGVASEPQVALPDAPRQSPVTASCRLVAQMTNYVSHIKDSGMDPKTRAARPSSARPRTP
jgi:hypothetical protein